MENQIFAGDSFFTKAGRLNTMSEEPLTVVFIGGSLTSGDLDYEGTRVRESNLKWPNTVLRFLNGLFPLREITAYNMGLGGTGSAYGAVRFSRDVISHKPDLVFIEFTVNDCPGKPIPDEEYRSAEVDRQVYMENMIRQCMEAEKVPAIVYINCPYAMEPDSEKAKAYYQSREFKNDIVNYYGIGIIDIYDGFLSEYNAIVKDNPSLSLVDYFKQYYSYENGVFGVHPPREGYQVYNMIILDALMRNPEKYLRPFKMRKDVYCRGEEKTIFERFNYLPHNSNRITYHGDWKVYDRDHLFETDIHEISIPEDRLKRDVFFPVGVSQVLDYKDAWYEFDTEADRICFPHIAANFGANAKVFANGVEVGTTTCYSLYHGMNYTAGWTVLPKGKKHIEVRIDNPSEGHTVYRFGYVVEAFYKD